MSGDVGRTITVRRGFTSHPNNWLNPFLKVSYLTKTVIINGSIHYQKCQIRQKQQIMINARDSKVTTGSIHVYKLALDTKTIQSELVGGNQNVVILQKFAYGQYVWGKGCSWIKTNVLGNQETLFRRPFLCIKHVRYLKSYLI